MGSEAEYKVEVILNHEPQKYGTNFFHVRCYE